MLTQTKVHDMAVWTKEAQMTEEQLKLCQEVKIENLVGKKEKVQRKDFQIDISVILHNFLSCIFKVRHNGAERQLLHYRDI